MQSQQQGECTSCEKPSNGICEVCHSTTMINEERPKSKFKNVFGLKTQVPCSSCNDPGNSHKKGDGKCFACKGKRYLTV